MAEKTQNTSNIWLIFLMLLPAACAITCLCLGKTTAAASIMLGSYGAIIIFGALKYRHNKHKQAAETENLRLQLAEARQLSYTDALTGMYNRWWYNEQLKKHHSQPEYRRRYAAILIDIDRFKDINDTYGHLYGDQVLLKVSAAIKAAMPEGALACRWGGDEFLCQARAASPEEAWDISENIRLQVEKEDFFTADKERLKVTVSIGCVYVEHPQNVYSSRLFALADQALYQAKHSGANLVCLKSADQQQ